MDTLQGTMAYLRELVNNCDEHGCSKRAVVRLVSWDNVSVGEFCRAHGTRKLAERLEMEKGHV